MSHPRSLFWPLLLIAAGAIWLLTQSGSIPSANLWALTHIWPYFLIAAGIGLILRPYWRYSSILMDILIIGGAVFAILYAPKLGWDNPSMTGFYFNDHSSAYFGPGTPGSGNVVTESREVSNFNTIELDYPAQVTVTQGKSESVKIEAEDNVLPGLQTRVRGNTLEIFYQISDGKHVNPTKAVKINVVVKDLKEVNFSSAGELIINGLDTDHLDISLSGAGSMTASGEADDFRLNISGFGSFNGKDLHTLTAKIDMSGAGSATVWVEDDLNASVSGVGSVNYYGSPKVTKQVSGVGSISKSGDK